MKWIVRISQFLVGALFIFSGAIKLNDPLGTAYKLEEYFHVFSADFGSFFELFIPYTVFLAVFICALEVILGVAILLNYRMKITMWITLLLIIFFTFLTFYSFYYDKVKECGCFGTVIVLTPKQSFYKDLVLLVLVVIVFIYKKHLKLNVPVLLGEIAMLLVTVASFYAGYHALEHLPFIDSLNFKVGNDLKKLTEPEERPEYMFVMSKGGKEYEFPQAKYPTDTNYKYVRHYLLNKDTTKLVPKVTNFEPSNEEGHNYKKEVLDGLDLIVVVADVQKAQKKCDGDCMKKITTLIKDVEKDNVKSVVFTKVANGSEFEEYRHENQLGVPYYFLDDTVLKMMIRSNPGILLLKNGVIVGKWHFNDTPSGDEVRKLIK